MEPPIIEKRGDKRPMSEPRHENQNQKRPRTVISETIQCVDIGEVSLPNEKGAARSISVLSQSSGKKEISVKFSEMDLLLLPPPLRLYHHHHHHPAVKLP